MPQDGAELSVNGCEITPAVLVMGEPYSAALPDHAIFEKKWKFICTRLYLNVDKKNSFEAPEWATTSENRVPNSVLGQGFLTLTRAGTPLRI